LKDDPNGRILLTMGVLIEEITEAALSLPFVDRALLADRLLDSLESRADQNSISDSWMSEIRRRVEEVRSGKAELVDGSEGLARVRESLRK
jgi:putative addiction module component (TIGR02574 family)